MERLAHVLSPPPPNSLHQIRQAVGCLCSSAPFVQTSVEGKRPTLANKGLAWLRRPFVLRFVLRPDFYVNFAFLCLASGPLLPEDLLLLLRICLPGTV